jgi:hypothetical protein
MPKTKKSVRQSHKPQMALMQLDETLPVNEFLRTGAIVFMDQSIVAKSQSQMSIELDVAIDPFYPTKRDVFEWSHKRVNFMLMGEHDALIWMKNHGIIVEKKTINSQLSTLQLIGKMAIMAKTIKEIPERLQDMEEESKSIVLKVITDIGKEFLSLAKLYDIDFSSFDEQKIPPNKIMVFLQEWMAA